MGDLIPSCLQTSNFSVGARLAVPKRRLNIHGRYEPPPKMKICRRGGPMCPPAFRAHTRVRPYGGLSRKACGYIFKTRSQVKLGNEKETVSFNPLRGWGKGSTDPPLPQNLFPHSLSVRSTATKALWGISTAPTIFMRFLPARCFSRSLRFRVMSPP
jgi:hypothetical protein